jgi:branched-chain amino acid transport system ATP-binding protein
MNALLTVSGLVKRFGGLTATDHVTFDVRPGEVHAIIGPNGAGKTTLISQLAGELHPDEGNVVFEGRDITRSSVPARSLAGLGRSYQISQIFREFTALENVMLAVQAHAGHSFAFMRRVASDANLVEPARLALEQVGLGARAGAIVASMAHGEHRQLELAMTLAGQPRLLLLDEPMAGMSQKESEEMLGLLRRFKGKYGVILVEHDMDAVLVYGRIIVTGTPAEIRNNREVRDAYLGDEESLA